MSTTETDIQEQNTQAPETGLIRRSFVADVTVGDGRTVDVRLVPFGEVARVADPPDYTPYDEEWLPGCFDHQLSAANRVHANYEHERGVTNVVGHGIGLFRKDDGYHITARIHDTNGGNTTLELLRADALPGVSLEAVPVKNVRSTSGVIQRQKANLLGFAFCRRGAFVGAQVLALRTDEDEPVTTVDEALLPVDMNPERVQRLRALGIVVPDRYQAHPEETDTPDDESGTSDDGTRHTDTTSSEE